MRRSARLILCLLCLMPWPGAALAGDGRGEINQARALSGGVTSSDAPGFPVTLDAPGSYVLTSNLDVPAGTVGLEILAPDVSIDLAGFTIDGGGASGILVHSTAPGTRVQSGSAVASGAAGIVLADDAGVSHVDSRSHAADGVVAGARAEVDHARATDNGGDGVVVGADSAVTNTLAHGNAGLGLNLGPGTGFAHNVSAANGVGAASGGVDAGHNVCDGSLSCPDACAGPEICDGLDNDCDGQIDEDDPGGGASCSTGLLGACDAGTLTCQGGVLSCLENTPPSAEICDGLDNDCDGAVDDGNPGGGGACSTGLPGVCGPGTQTCQGGALSCLENTPPSAEICDGLDNDCDGQVDEPDAVGCTTFYTDSDGDGFGTAPSACLCAPAGPFTAANSLDCYDLNGQAFPGQAAYFTVPRGDGSFDYDCNSSQQPQYPTPGSCSAPPTCTATEGWQSGVASCGQTQPWVSSCSFNLVTCDQSTIARTQGCR